MLIVSTGRVTLEAPNNRGETSEAASLHAPFLGRRYRLQLLLGVCDLQDDFTRSSLPVLC